jgi:hypothetical protein
MPVVQNQGALADMLEALDLMGLQDPGCDLGNQ